ncbi:mediator of RNA polymerase ii transcription subunit 12 [Anaeramoeba ignava]|uniref:Mediator of RNA polymerase ii transcription subunit 12 n=1 Tax=Anaeramoeba ignava TaxID=1746090 RepID=A0A9Q0LQH9_ANAIG|nr:mediator of RNA polymerase ii transcription subunit 12 [Anaeramoeba ignava]
MQTKRLRSNKTTPKTQKMDIQHQNITNQGYTTQKSGKYEVRKEKRPTITRSNRKRTKGLVPFKLKPPPQMKPLSKDLSFPDFYPVPAPSEQEYSLMPKGFEVTFPTNFDQFSSAIKKISQNVEEIEKNIQKGFEKVEKARKELRDKMLLEKLRKESQPFLRFPKMRVLLSGEDQLAFTKKLAGKCTLAELSKQIPIKSLQRGFDLLEEFVDNEVPFLRAVWILKVTYLQELGRKQQDFLNQNKRNKQWTLKLVEYIQEYLKKNPFQNLETRTNANANINTNINTNSETQKDPNIPSKSIFFRSS